MKLNKLFFAIALLSVFSLQSCLKDNCDRTVSYIQIDPVYKTLDEIHAGAVVEEAPRALTDPGQFYYFNNYMFINERGEGIHVIDNSDPANPVPTAFLAIPGNEDLAIKNGMLYANSYVDLLAIDLNTYQLAGRTENVFVPEWQDISDGKIIVEWKETPKTEVVDCEVYDSFNKRGGEFYLLENVDANVAFENIAISGQSNNPGGAGSFGTGVGGSMARFTIMSDYLYAIDETGMELFDLAQPASPSNIARVEIGWGIETIFPYEDKLFIGSNNGMFIYDNSDPTQPTQLSDFAHARSCDPVFVNGNYAYVTLRSGNTCEGFANQLDLIDISNLENPVLRKSFKMDNPHGLSINDDKLFLCEGEFGLKSFDIFNPLVLGDHKLDQIKNINAFDAISLPGNNDVVMVIGDDGFYQYAYDEYGKLTELSKISIAR